MARQLFHIMIMLLFTACGDTAYHSQLRLLYKDTVPTISADSLSQLLEQPHSIVLIDTRSRKEWQISHLPHAQFADFEEFKLSSLNIRDRTIPVVLYCSIGYRSEQIGKQLQEAGFTRVSHLYGGIIEWKNHAYPLLNKKSLPTDSVHTYDPYWGTFLNNGIPVYE
jgi:rhodanese-related sulfurtransferase